MTPDHLKELADARALLENPGFAARVSNFVGKPIELGLQRLPASWQGKVAQATEKALTLTMNGALSTMSTLDKGNPLPSPRLHKMAATFTGAAGGFFGLAALPVELPVSTGVIFRSIADIARSHGENLSDPAVHLECLKVFALGGNSPKDDAGESGYLAVRATMAKAINEAAQYLASHTLAGEGAPVLVRLVALIASRFQIQVTEKVAAQAVPIIGAVAGGTINFLFVSHFQDMSRGHFTVRRLERIYGADEVTRHYKALGAR